MKDFFPYWKQKAQEKRIVADDFVVRALFIAMQSKSTDKVHVFTNLISKYFSPIKDENKLKSTLYGEFDSPLRGVLRINHTLSTHTLDMLMSNKIHSYWDQYNDFEFLKHIETEQEWQVATSIIQPECECAKHRQLSLDEYVYLFMRTDISPVQQVVQAAHVALKLGAMLAKDGIQTDDLYFVLCDGGDLARLGEIGAEVYNHSKIVGFIEPDLGDETTGYATYPIPVNKKKDFSKYKLLTINKEEK